MRNRQRSGLAKPWTARPRAKWTSSDARTTRQTIRVMIQASYPTGKSKHEISCAKILVWRARFDEIATGGGLQH